MSIQDMIEARRVKAHMTVDGKLVKNAPIDSEAMAIDKLCTKIADELRVRLMFKREKQALSNNINYSTEAYVFTKDQIWELLHALVSKI